MALEPGVIVVHNLPKDFAERELKDYFEQFGPVSRLRVSRSRKTRGTRGYAYVEFQCKDVAEIAAQSMHNYLMFGRVLKCQFLPRERVHSKMFHGSQNQITTVARHKARVNQAKTTQNLENILKRRRKMLKVSQEKLARFGIKFEPVIINCPENIKILQDSAPAMNVEPEELKVKKKVRKLSQKQVIKSEPLPLETITLKAKKKAVRKRPRSDQ